MCTQVLSDISEYCRKAIKNHASFVLALYDNNTVSFTAIIMLKLKHRDQSLSNWAIVLIRKLVKA